MKQKKIFSFQSDVILIEGEYLRSNGSPTCFISSTHIYLMEQDGNWDDKKRDQKWGLCFFPKGKNIPWIRRKASMTIKAHANKKADWSMSQFVLKILHFMCQEKAKHLNNSIRQRFLIVKWLSDLCENIFCNLYTSLKWPKKAFVTWWGWKAMNNETDSNLFSRCCLKFLHT